ncbi:hypothetical protein B0T21DRAFT_289238, partial [Apiosordaria backusii]
TLEDEGDFHFLKLEFLHRLNITQLGVKLVRLKSEIQRGGSASEGTLEILQNNLKDYTSAIRDYRFIHTQKAVPKADMMSRKLLMERFFQTPSDFSEPFYSHYAYFADADAKFDPMRDAFMTHLLVRLTYSHEERRQCSKEFRQGKKPKQVSKFVDRSVRLIVSITGGLSLVTPMVIMSLQPSLLKSLVTVSVAVLLFAFGLAFGVRVSNAETLVSTATYAAVLVVFVGVSNPQTQG